MKIIAIDAREIRTSTGRYIERLLNYLQKIDNDHEYLVLLKPGDMEGWTPTNKNFHKIACPHKEFTFGEQIGFKKQLDGLSADLVHFAMVQQPVKYSGKVVTTMHDLTTARFKNPDKNPVVFTAKQQVYKWVNKEVAKKSEFILVPSNYIKTDLIQFTDISPSKIVVTYEAADKIEDEPKAVKELAGKQFIMYVGRPTPHKNLDRLVEAFGLVHESHPDLLLALVGKTDSNYKVLEEKVTSKAIDNVIFTGFVSDGQLRWLYEHCVAYVFPSLSEGFGLPGLEAMAQGAPVISSNASCLPEIYGDSAYYFYPYHTKEIANAIGKIVKNKKLRDSLILKGKNQVSKYSWQRMAEQTLDVYKKVLGES